MIAPDTPGPELRIVRPDATAEEVAALVAVLSVLRRGAAPSQARPRREWATPARGVRRALPQGAGAWRSSGLPH